MEKTLKRTLTLLPILLVILIVIEFTPFSSETLSSLLHKEKLVIQSTSTDSYQRVPEINELEKKEEPPVVEEVIKPKLYDYIEVTSSCGPYFEGACVNVRSKPNKNSPSVTKLRNGVVLKVKEKITNDVGEVWYKITFEDEWLRYADRVKGDWYVSGDFVTSFTDVGVQEVVRGILATSTKYIIVDRSDQKLYAYEGKELFMEEKISTGIELTPTPRGTFDVYKKTPSRYMQGPLPGISKKYYDLPGVPWNLYFSAQGAVVHGAYWHDKFGKRWSSGCVNLPSEQAKKLYLWADLGMKVIVRD